MPNLYFCFPSKEAGGMSMLFMRIAEYLSKMNLAKTFLIDYSDGYIATNRDKNLTNLVVYEDGKTVNIPDSSILVLQSMTPWSIFPGLEIDDNVKVIFWSCYPFGLIPLLPGLRTNMQASSKLSAVILNSILYGYKIKMRNFSELLLHSKALIFQDIANVKITQSYLDMNIPDPKFLTIPSTPPGRLKENPQRIIADKKILKFSWVGRIVDMKYFILKYTLFKLNSIQDELGYKIELNIIGEGNYLKRLKRDCSKLNNLSISFIDHLPPPELNNFLLSDTDILLAMGTSALEGAKLGIPTLLLDVSFKEIPEGYKYTWLHDRSNNEIADILDFRDLDKDNKSLIEKIKEVLSSYENVSKKEREYFLNNHSLDNISKSLFKYSLRSTLTWKMLKENNFIERGYLYRVFSIIRSLFIK